VIFGGTPQFLEDTRRGLFSYEALRSRLTDSRFAESGYTTLTSPVIRLRRLSDNELYALLSRLSKLHAMQRGADELLSEEEKQEFLSFALERAGASELLTPREMIRDFMTLLQILSENPDADFKRLLYAQKATPEKVKPEENQGGIDLSDFNF